MTTVSSHCAKHSTALSRPQATPSRHCPYAQVPQLPFRPTPRPRPDTPPLVFWFHPLPFPFLHCRSGAAAERCGGPYY